MIGFYFVLTLYCLTCQPLQAIEVHNIPPFDAGSTIWADLNCKTMGDILSGDFERRNMATASLVGKITARKVYITYTCALESDDF